MKSSGVSCHDSVQDVTVGTLRVRRRVRRHCIPCGPQAYIDGTDFLRLDQSAGQQGQRADGQEREEREEGKREAFA